MNSHEQAPRANDERDATSHPHPAAMLIDKDHYRPTDANDAEHDIVIYPEEVEDDFGIYGESAIELFKELRASSVDVAYYHDVEHRRWRKLMSAELAVAFVIGFIANAAWYAIQRVLEKKSNSEIRVCIVTTRNSDSGHKSQWFEAEGSAQEVAASVEAFMEQAEANDSSD